MVYLPINLPLKKLTKCRYIHNILVPRILCERFFRLHWDQKKEKDGAYTGHEYDNQPKQGITLSPIQWKMGVSPILVSFCLE